MDSKILTLAKIESNRKKLFLLIVPIIYFLNLAKVYLFELFSIQDKWVEKSGGSISLSQIISQFSVLDILRSSNYSFGAGLMFTIILGAMPLYLLLWYVVPFFSKETNKGWKRVYVAGSFYFVCNFFILLCATYKCSSLLQCNGFSFSHWRAMGFFWFEKDKSLKNGNN